MIKTKMLAVLMVSLMMAVTVVPMMGEESDATTGTLEALDPGSWTWDLTTGIGPYNSFYAAFDMSNNANFVSVLNPYNLTKKIDGTDLGSGNYNIMWVIPTVYWSVDQSGNITLTNDSNNGTAYAHTYEGHTYKYIAIGVYEATADPTMSGGSTYPASQSGQTPIQGNAILAGLTTSLSTTELGNNSFATLWGFYMYELYKYISWSVMEDFNSQKIVGWGYTYTTDTTQSIAGTSTTTGETDVLGPYVGLCGEKTTQNASHSEKLFIENAWGSLKDLVVGFYYHHDNDRLYISSAKNMSHDNLNSQYVTTFDNVDFINNPSGYSTEIDTTTNFWGMAINDTGTDVTGLSDKHNTGTSWSTGWFYAGMTVGGCANTEQYISDWGLNHTDIRKEYMFGAGNNWPGNVGSRLSYVFDTDLTNNEFNSYNYTLNYDATKMSTGSNAISVANMEPIHHNVTVDFASEQYGSVDTSDSFNIPIYSTITVDDNTIVIGDTTITATPQSPTTTQTFSFAGWYNGSTLLTDGEVEINDDTTITAHFSSAVRTYSVTFASNNGDYGSVSPTSASVEYNTAIASASNVVTLGTSPDTVDYTATPTSATVQYTYTFDSWTGIPNGGAIIEDTTITANFVQSLTTYTITWVVGDSSTTETYDYGATPTHENPTPPDGYYFVGWNPEIATVTGDQTYTAVFSNMTVTFDPGSGTLQGDASKVVVIGQPIGELPTCTAPTNYTFDGWYTAATGGTKVTEDTIVTQDASFTLYAHYELVPALQPVKAILDVMPILIAVGLILGAVYVFMTRPELATTNNLLYAIVGISVAVLMLAVIVIPIIGNAL